MGSVRYIGSKVRIVDRIVRVLGKPQNGKTRFVDVFSGTGAVSRAAAGCGWAVRANDYLNCSAAMTTAQLISENDVSFRRIGGYRAAIRRLNQLSGKPGFIYREYAPSGLSASGHIRKYFTDANAMKIDSVREQIRRWSEEGLLSRNEQLLLVADLLEATNRIANIAGTYGCYLRAWEPSALQDFKLCARNLLPKKSRFKVTTEDSFELTTSSEDVAYLDPPYTKRQYPAYYHVLETIAVGDEPKVGGVTGLRPWKDKSSPFCFKRKALGAFRDLLEGLSAQRVLISYSSEGHISLETLAGLLSEYGKVDVHALGTITRYTPNVEASSKSFGVKEYILELSRQGWDGPQRRLI